ncbi:MAG: chromosomal replication initiator protein DnaA [Methanomassiliicoccales archaeon]|nr:chromosomal replication initiator protein DnaA [Methanomassiliicoccales archaeon]
MLIEAGFPDARVIEKTSGGEGVLSNIIDRIKKESFSGYARIGLRQPQSESEGVILFEAGEPIGALYVDRRGQNNAEKIYRGERALEFIFEDSQYSNASISLHTGLDPRDILKRFEGAEIKGFQVVPSFSTPPPSKPVDLSVLAGNMNAVAKKIESWAREGFVVSRLLDIYLDDPDKASRILPHFEANVERARALIERLRFLNKVGIEREVESILRKAMDPERIEEAEIEFDLLAKRIERSEKEKLAEKEIRLDIERKKQNERIDHVYDLILQYHKMRALGTEKRARCPKCGEVLDRDGFCSKCNEFVTQKPQYGRAINPRYTFSQFVVGHSNRFAVAAAKAVASNPGTAYNPLFIYSRSGLGKTHLLHAIGNEILERHQNLLVIYTSMEKFETELIEAISLNKVEEFRKAHSKVDVLLIDDVQFIAGRERTQEELFQIFNDLLENERQIVLASDRLPKEIPSLSERLLTRFESGLIADIQPPDYETRVAILEKKVREERIAVPKEVLEFIANVCRDNVRQLEGGLNRIVAFSSLMRTDIDLALAKEVLSHEAEGMRIKEFKFDLAGGQSYLVEEPKPEVAHRAFVSKVQEGYKGLAITRGHPRNLAGKLGQLQATIYWLTDRESTVVQTLPPSLERIMLVIEEFIRTNEKCVILLDDIQYLISNTTFEGIVRFIRSVVDEISETPSIFVVSVNEESLSPQDRSILEREMEVLKTS